MENEVQENSVPQNEEEANELLSSIEQPQNGATQEAEPQAQQPQAASEFAFTVGGKEIKVDLGKDREKLIRWAQQGYDAPNQLGKLRQELQTWQKKFQESEPKWKEIESKYGEIDSYMRQNPQFWDHVTQSWQNRSQAMNDPANPLTPMIQQLSQKYETIEQKLARIEQAEQQKVMAQEDSAYQKEFEELKTAYPQIDFATPDDQGKSLEYKVLEYAQENGIRKFTTAFRDFYHDDLMKMREESAKEKVVRDKQKNSKLGILGITQQPTRKSSDDVRGKSWDQLADDIKQEYKLS